MKIISLLKLTITSILISSGLFICSVSADTSIAHITLLHINDVYEIMPLNKGKQGGLPKLASVRKQLLSHNPNTYTILSGDLFSPSAIGTARIDGESLAGKQMVDLMNLAGLDYATFGNHEFDLKEALFLKRLEESKFKWFSANVLNKNSQAFKNVSDYEILEITAPNNKIVKIALIGVTIDSNPRDYVTYKDPFSSIKKQIKLLKDKVDIIIAVTHLSIDNDIKLAELEPELDLILGGHEHKNIQVLRGNNFTPIYKADANVRSAYIHDLFYNTQTGKLKIISYLKVVNEQVIDNPEVFKRAEYWQGLAFSAFEKEGFSPKNIVVISNINLNGLESQVRKETTNLTKIIADSMLHLVPDSELAIFNSGSIRIDDEIPAGGITEYDIIRILPYGGNVLSVTMKGSLLKQVLEQGLKNKGSGGYLQAANCIKKATVWYINNQRLDETYHYKVSINDFLVSGREENLGYLNIKNNDDIKLISNYGDTRNALIKELKTIFPSH